MHTRLLVTFVKSIGHQVRIVHVPLQVAHSGEGPGAATDDVATVPSVASRMSSNVGKGFTRLVDKLIETRNVLEYAYLKSERVVHRSSHRAQVKSVDAGGPLVFRGRTWV